MNPTIGVLMLALLMLGVLPERALATQFVSGLVPDWNQPYHYTPASMNGGPGPDPGAPGQVNQWNAWCAPSSAANLAGHWADFRGLSVADTTAFPNSTVFWAVGPSWQDYEADGTATRPAPQPINGWVPPTKTDIGWYMDSNRGVLFDIGPGVMGGYGYGNAGHTGTYIKDIHAGLLKYLGYSLDATVVAWTTGTRGKSYAAGTGPTGAVATIYANAAEAFGDVKLEIDRNRTLILSYLHWIINPTGLQLLPAGVNTESGFGGAYYTWGVYPGGGNGEDEEWNNYAGGDGLGHAVTAVGYIPAGDPDDQWQAAGLQGPTDWVIVHDNWATTPRNVIIPFNYAGTWAANSFADPEFAPPDPEEPKWSQPPDLANGTDILSIKPAIINDPPGIVADDFLCDGRPISGIRWWGSYIGYHTNSPGPYQPPANRPDGFELRWYDDVAAGLMAAYSFPARPPIRIEYHGIGSCQEAYYTNVWHDWAGSWEHEFVYRVSLSNDWNEKQGRIYWLSVVAVYTNPPLSNGWGWATTAPQNGWNDAAVRRDPNPANPVGWMPLDYWGVVPPYGSNAVDMAFELLTDVTNSRATKWLQPPDMTWGENMASYTNLVPPGYWALRADDFVSDGRRITDIHWWGSYIDWNNKEPGPIEELVSHPSPLATPLGFNLSWHMDIPKGVQDPFSMPGEVLTNLYVPFDQCHEVYYGSVTQYWKGPGIFDHEFQYYVDLLDPDIANAAPWLEQKGVIYWLNIQAVFTNGWEQEHEHNGWGWKNTAGTNNWNDASVIAEAQQSGWIPAPFPPGNPNNPPYPFCDLAFELTTDEAGTNRWSGDIKITRYTVSTNVGSSVASVGNVGAGKQYLQCNTNLTVTNTWVAVATNKLPRPRPYTNWWSHAIGVSSTLFYRVIQK
jgi:hypothetical protein